MQYAPVSELSDEEIISQLSSPTISNINPIDVLDPDLKQKIKQLRQRNDLSALNKACLLSWDMQING